MDDSMYERDGAEATKTAESLHEASDGGCDLYENANKCHDGGPGPICEAETFGVRVI